MLLYLAFLLGVLPCAAQDNGPLSEPGAMTMGSDASHSDLGGFVGPSEEAPAPALPCGGGAEELGRALSQLVQEQQSASSWRSEVLSGLSQLVQEHKEVASGQVELVKLLRDIRDHSGQQLTHLQNLARHQSLLVENHQALLLQVSRIANELQDLTKKIHKRSISK